MTPDRSDDAEDPAPRPRSPSQARSRRRLEGILGAADTLLRTSNIEDISLNDLAREADISPASVHYLFPSMVSLQAELRRRYDAAFSRMLLGFHAELAKRPVSTWQDWIRLEAAHAREHYNLDRPACEVLLGPLLHRENAMANVRGNAEVGASNLETLRRLFVVPDLPGLEACFARSCAIIEMFWTRSYLATGTIGDLAFEHSVRAAVGYLRNFLPEILERRAEDPVAVPRAPSGRRAGRGSRSLKDRRPPPGRR
jgi:AcrR family transcriptional regulator